MPTLIYTFPHASLTAIQTKLQTESVYFSTGGNIVEMVSIDITDLDNPTITADDGTVYVMNSMVLDVTDPV